MEKEKEQKAKDTMREDFSFAWHVLHCTAKDCSGKTVSEQYGACYTLKAAARLQQMSMQDVGQMKALAVQFRNSEQFKEAENNGWLELSAEDLQKKKAGLLDPIQGRTLADINKILLKRGFSTVRESDVQNQTVTVDC